LSSIIQAAHDAGKPVLFTIGGWGNHAEFSKAIKPENRSTLIESILYTMTTWGFDGVDLDLEPIYDSDVEHYRNFIVELHQALQTVSTPLRATPLLTVATNGQPKLFAAVHEKLDQINLMTYDFSGAWNGWVSWHNAAVCSSHSFPGLAKPLPSVDNMVQAYLDAGVPPSKLGIGIDFYGYVWSGGHGMPSGGATAPNQSWSIPPTVTDNVPYHKIMDEYRPASTYSWDSEAQAAYLSIDQPGSSDDKFISYDDERSIQAKFDYVADHGLGGLIIWELTGGYRANQPAGQRDLLLQAVKDALQEHRRTNATPARLVKDK
jgi:chitinase